MKISCHSARLSTPQGSSPPTCPGIRATATRSSERKRRPSRPPNHNKSVLQLDLEAASGTSKMLRLVQAASDKDIAELNSAQWTPLVSAIFLLGKGTTCRGNSAASEEQLLQLVRVCNQRGLSPNSSAWFGDHLHRLLVLAAYYGFHAVVRRVISECEAWPDLGYGEGRPAWHRAFDSPVRCPGLRECDRLTAQTLLDLGVVTKDLAGTWRQLPKGSSCYMNADSPPSVL